MAATQKGVYLMSTLFYESAFDPFDILVRNYFQNSKTFSSLTDTKLTHPVDIYLDKREKDGGLVFEIACTGIPKEKVNLFIQGNILQVVFEKDKEVANSETEYLHKGIAKRSFNLGWKVDTKFDLTKSEAVFENGLLTIKIPYSDGLEMRKIEIQ